MVGQVEDRRVPRHVLRAEPHRAEAGVRRVGAVRFRAEDMARHPAVLDLADHSRYYASGGESLDNVVQVVVGDGADVRRAAYRGELPWAPDGISLDPEADRRPRAVP